jgi:dTDP-4-dehydrorhamnose reductase
MKVLILGASGMLGHKMAEVLKDLHPIALTRGEFEATEDSLQEFQLGDDDWIINCIGAIPQKTSKIYDMLALNTAFPLRLANENSQKILQIGTDCVYSGSTGGYDELSQPDGKDLYGVTKRLGEASRPNVMLLRTSIVGPELTSKRSLFEWVRNQPEGAVIEGYADHRWNGVTTQAFARVAKGIISGGLFSPGTQHLVPADTVSKAELVRLIADRLGRDDITVVPVETDKPIDRTLATREPELNAKLWQAGGYSEPPTISEMIGAISV